MQMMQPKQCASSCTTAYSTGWLMLRVLLTLLLQQQKMQEGQQPHMQQREQQHLVAV
jgi:hypothetical protein